MMKKFLLTSAETKAKEILKSFLRKKSLYQLRSEIRGKMGLPRMRSNDDSFISSNSFKDKGRNRGKPLLSPQSNRHKTQSINFSLCMNDVNDVR